MYGATERWAQTRGPRGLTDDQLTDALRFELGIFGGASAREDGPALTFRSIEAARTFSPVLAYIVLPVHKKC